MGNFSSTSVIASALEQQQESSLWTQSTDWLEAVFSSIKTATLGLHASPAIAADVEDFDLLAMARPDLWELCARVKDDDCESCATEATEMLSETEIGSEDEQDDADDDFFDACDDEYEPDYTDDEEPVAQAAKCVCDPLVSRLHQLAASPSAGRILLFLDDYLCQCGECLHAKKIACDVDESGVWTTEQEKRSLTRLLQAFATYNEVIGYSRTTLTAALECLRMWNGAEDHAFTSFVLLMEDATK